MRRSIGKSDIEFYHSHIVLTVAKILGDKPWNDITYRTRNRRLDRAVDIVHTLLNDQLTLEKLELYLHHNPING